MIAGLAAGTVCNAAAVHRDTSGGDSWHRFVRSPSNPIVKPHSILSANTTGDVTNPSGLLGGNGNPTVMTRKEGDMPPSLVVDFGQDVVGIVSISFAGSTNSTEGFPGLKLAFSETQQYLTNTSDFTRSDNLPVVCQDEASSLRDLNTDILERAQRLPMELIRYEHKLKFRMLDVLRRYSDCCCKRAIHLERFNWLPTRHQGVLRWSSRIPVYEDLA